MKLSENFTLDELCVTNTGLVNVPNAAELEALKVLVSNVLQPLRVKYGKPIKINSGYRSPIVNKRVKGAPKSQHVKGEAADITGGSREENMKLFHAILEIGKYDQLINEYDFSWIHVSYKKEGNRKEVGKITHGGKYSKLN